MNYQASTFLPPPLALAIDTSSPVLSLAVAGAQGVLATTLGDPQVPHSKSLFHLIPRVLAKAGATIDDVTVFAATTGPGSFTGLRVGLATVKGLAQARRAALRGVTTLESLAWAAEARSALVVPLINSPRGDVFCGFFSASADGRLLRAADNAMRRPGEILNGLLVCEKPVVMIGDGAVAHRTEIEAQAASAGLSFACTAPGGALAAAWNLIEIAPPLAPVIAARALALPDDATYGGAHPHYLRPSDAEAKIGA
jgi:tRNA threonylcarbamoyladenosine biosynthesis protein TsaB